MSLRHFLDAEHLDTLKQALNNLLSTPIAEETYAQILDGMPLALVYAGDHWYTECLPDFVTQHEELCPGVLEKTRSLRAEFDIHSLALPPQTVQAYQDTKFGTVAWKLRLVELVAMACHEIAVYLYQLDEGVHKHAEWEDWRSEKLALLSPNASEEDRSEYGPPALFYVGAYLAVNRYSHGLADVVAYWAEKQIFGGIVLFDRGLNEEECNGMYLHKSWHRTLAPPTEEQFNDLMDLLVSPSPDPARCPLPLHIDTDNKWRWDAYKGMAEYHIYKYRQDIIEAPSPPDSPRPCRNWRRIRQDWPEVIEKRAADHEMRKKAAGEPYDETAWEKLARVITPTSIYWNLCQRNLDNMLEDQDEKKRGRPPYFFDP